MQFYPPSKDILKKERDVVQLPTASPRFSTPTDVLRDLKDLCYTTEVRCFDIVCAAARYRAAFFSSAFHRGREALAAVAENDERTLLPSLPSWRANSIMYQMIEHYDWVHSILRVPHDPCSELQKKLGWR